MKKPMNWLRGCIGVAACLLLANTWPAQAEQSVLIKRELQVGNLARFFWVHLPRGVKPERPSPVVLVLHGGGGADAETMSRRYHFNGIADREGFIVVYPFGVDGQWNDGRGKSLRPRKDNSKVDDVGYIRAVIDDLVREYGTDTSRVYVTGLSNGGMMTYRLGIELGDRLAAIAAMIANIPANLIGEKPRSPLSVLIMNGTEDPLIPWKGGAVRVLGSKYGDVVSTERTVQYWLEWDGITSKPEQVMLPDQAPHDGCHVELTAYRKEGGALEVLLYTIKGGGHNVPGSDSPDRPRLIGRKCMDINASEVIWEFFKRHARGPTQQPASENGCTPTGS